MKDRVRALVKRLWYSGALSPARAAVRAVANRDVEFAIGLQELHLERRRLLAEIRSAGGRPRGYSSTDAPDLRDYLSQVQRNYDPFANPFQYYRFVIDELSALPSIDLVPLADLFAPAEGERARMGLRHDVDADPVAALRCARFLAQRGICGSFFLLHTAPYYGTFIDGLFLRNPQLRDWVHGMIVAGCEIGMHNDALGVELQHGIDGADALRSEIEWLREQGAQIRGTVAHNSAPVHGAENYEVFEERLLERRHVENGHGGALPLGALSEKDLGLAYEGTFARPKASPDAAAARAYLEDAEGADIRSEPWMRRYLLANPLCDWDVDVQFWLTGTDCWVIGGRTEAGEIFEWEVDAVRMVSVAAELPANSRSSLIIHPEYVGR